MRFRTPENYSVIVRGQLVYSVGGVIDTDDKEVIAELQKNDKVKAEEKAKATKGGGA